MSEEKFSNREITAMCHSISERLDMHMKLSSDANDEIIELQKYTNGKVGELVKWRERVNGGAAVAGVFMSIIVIPILGWSVWSLVHLPQMIQKAVQEALVVYEIP